MPLLMPPETPQTALLMPQPPFLPLMLKEWPFGLNLLTSLLLCQRVSYLGLFNCELKIREATRPVRGEHMHALGLLSAPRIFCQTIYLVLQIANKC